jgi:hypothetical protein
MATLHSKSFDKPDETRPFKGHGHLDLLKFDEQHSVGRAEFEPGWKWSVDVKPIAGTQSCLSEHIGTCLAGRMVIHMDNGEEFTVKAGDAYYIQPGHDAWTVGNERCVMIDVTGFRDYAKKH